MSRTAPASPPGRPAAGSLPPLQNGDQLTREEFHRRYEAMSELRQAELIEGVVYVASPVNHKHHGKPHYRVSAWIAHYEASTPGVDGGLQSTILLDWQNEPQPDAFLRVLPDRGGQTRDTPENYIEGAPELIAEVAASSASCDLHPKKAAYCRNRVREYVVVRTCDGAVDWFVLRGSQYDRLAPDPAGIHRSEVFPGLWLDAAALLRGDMAAVLRVLGEGLASREHAELVERLARPAETG